MEVFCHDTYKIFPVLGIFRATLSAFRRLFSSIGGEGEPNLLVFALCRYLGLNQTGPGTNKLGVKRYREVIKAKILQP